MAAILGWEWEFYNDASFITSEGSLVFNKKFLSSKLKRLNYVFFTHASESKANAIKTDFSYKCMLRMVCYATSNGKFDKIMDPKDLGLLGELCSAIDFFGFEDMKTVCAENLSEMVSNLGFFSFLNEVAKLNKEAPVLTNKCVELLERDPTAIESEEFMSIMGVRPKFATFIIKNLLTAKNGEKLGAKNSSILNLFNRAEFTDVTLKCSSGSVTCHKVILAANSSVFKKQLLALNRDQKSRKRKIDGTPVVMCELKINDFDKDCIEKLVLHMYSGEIDDEDVDADLYLAADHFNVLELKAKCERILLNSNVNAENVLDILQVAWKTKCHPMINKCIPILINSPDVMTSAKYRDVVLKDQSLSLSVTMKLAEKCRVSAL